MTDKQVAANSLRERAEILEHRSEFNQTVVARWSPEQQVKNTRQILQARALRDEADRLECICETERTAGTGDYEVTPGCPIHDAYNA
jgi:hypothetical protein